MYDVLFIKHSCIKIPYLSFSHTIEHIFSHKTGPSRDAPTRILGAKHISNKTKSWTTQTRAKRLWLTMRDFEWATMTPGHLPILVHIFEAQFGREKSSLRESERECEWEKHGKRGSYQLRISKEDADCFPQTCIGKQKLSRFWERLTGFGVGYSICMFRGFNICMFWVSTCNVAIRSQCGFDLNITIAISHTHTHTYTHMT